MLNPDFKELLQLFDEKHVEYLLVGGYAMAAHGHPRYTGDIDLWIWTKPENAHKIMSALEEFGFGNLGIQALDFQKPEQVIQLGFPPARIDILTDIDGVAFAECWSHRVLIDMDGISVPVISKADLIRNKTASNRLQDKADLEKLT
jgi:predicted nucleotidyltransferase